jgi:hypothetical protein
VVGKDDASLSPAGRGGHTRGPRFPHALTRCVAAAPPARAHCTPLQRVPGTPLQRVPSALTPECVAICQRTTHPACVGKLPLSGVVLFRGGSTQHALAERAE